VIGRFPHQRVNEVGTAEGSGDDGVDISSIRSAKFDVLANVREHIMVAEGDEG